MPAKNKIASVLSSAVLVAAAIPWGRVAVLFGIPGSIDDAKAWSVMPVWVYVPLLLAAGVWVGAAWSHELIKVVGGEWPDFDKWDQRPEFRLWEAANLWVDREPTLPLDRRAKAAFRKLDRGIQDKTLPVLRQDLRETIEDAYGKVEHGTVPKANPNWGVKRSDLLSFTHSLGEKPRFLYPKERV